MEPIAGVTPAVLVAIVRYGRAEFNQGYNGDSADPEPDRLALLAAIAAAAPPREPTPAMVEAMARVICPDKLTRPRLWRDAVAKARAAWAAGLATWVAPVGSMMIEAARREGPKP